MMAHKREKAGTVMGALASLVGYNCAGEETVRRWFGENQ